MRSSSFVLSLLMFILAPLTVIAWESSGVNVLYTMEDLVDSSYGAVTTADSVKFVITELITISAGDTLLIDPGDSLCFQKISPVIVLKINGYLLADGTAQNPIVFTSNESSPDTSNWGRIEFEKNPAGSIFDHCNISYAATALSCDSSALATISNVNISKVGSNGLSLKNSSPTISNCTLTDFAGSGIVCTGNSAPLLGGSLAASNTMYNALPPTGFTFKNFTANTITATHNNWGTPSYTYIDSIIVDDDEGPYGQVVFIPIYDVTPPQSIADLAASLADTNVSLTWSAVTTDTSGSQENLSHYVIYRDTTAYFNPQSSDSIAASTDTFYTDFTSNVGDVSTNSFYLVMAADDAGNKSALSNRVGEYDYALKTTTGSDYTWIVFCLGDTDLVMTSDLWDHIEAHSSDSTTCKTIAEWNATAQTYNKYLGIPFTDFPLQPGHAYRVEISDETIWTLTGDVLPSDSVSFQLKTTTGSDYTWISIPLHLDSLQMTSDLWDHIEAHSSDNTTCQTIAEWNATAQTYNKYLGIPFTDFPVRPGRAYRVEVTADATWPFGSKAVPGDGLRRRSR